MKTSHAAWSRPLAVLCLAGLLAGCGGGSSGGTAPTDPPPDVKPPAASTPLPATLAITLPARLETGAEQRYAVQPGITGADLQWTWDFGDGSTSAEARPVHAHARAGTYRVTLTLRNGAGQTVQAAGEVTVGAYARLAGRSCSQPDAGGWCWMQPLQPERRLYALQWADADHALAVGELGHVVATADGGRSWSAAAPVPGDETVQQLARAADGSWLAVARPSRRVWRSTDEARSWVPVSTLPDGARNGFWATPDGTLVANSDSGAFISTDGGSSWRTRTLLRPNPFMPQEMGVDHVSGQGLWWMLGRAYLSRDQGVTVERVMPCCEQQVLAESLDGATRLDLLVTPDPGLGPATRRVLHRGSIDGGRTWAETPVQLPPQRAGHRLRAATLFGDGAGLGLIGAPDPNVPDLFVDNALVTTADGGRSWTLLRELSDRPWTDALPDFAWPAVDTRTIWTGWPYGSRNDPAFALLDAGTGQVRVLQVPGEAHAPSQVQRLPRGGLLVRYGFGGNAEPLPSRWYVSFDEGARWAAVTPTDTEGAPYAAVVALGFFDGQVGLSLTFDGRMQRTVDGGRTWADVTGVEPGRTRALQVAPDGTAWRMAGGDLWRSDDRGLTWQLRRSGLRNPAAVQFVDATQGWAVSDECNYEIFSPCSFDLHRTVDGGATWQRTPLSMGHQTMRVAFADRKVGVAADIRGVQRTEDGGLTWLPVTLPGLYGGVHLLHADVQGRFWYAPARNHDGILRSSDGGRSWQAIRLPLDNVVGADNDLNDIHFADARHGWLVGGGGVLLATDDGGDTWRVQRSGSAEALTRVHAVDARTVWAGGERGTLLTTSSGGD